MQALLVIRARWFEGPSFKEKLGAQTCVQAPSREILATGFIVIVNQKAKAREISKFPLFP